MKSMPSKDEVREALRAVIDPELRRSIVELDMVRSIEVHDSTGVVDVTVSLTTGGCPIRNHFEDGVAKAVRTLDGVTGVNVDFDVLSDQQKSSLQQKLGRGSLPEGALAEEGKRVGVLDADVWGYSIPRMLGLGAQRPKVSAERKILPLDAHSTSVMSIGFFVEEDSPVVWRGPMLHKALTQFLEDVAWGEQDFLL